MRDHAPILAMLQAKPKVADTQCVWCWLERDEDSFRGNKGVTRVCRPCRDALRAGNVSMRGKTLWETYRLGPKDLQELLRKQDYLCTICTKALGDKFHIDHCHRTGILRGLLCHQCNIGLGNFGDDTTRMQRAIEYLQKGQTTGFVHLRVARKSQKE